MLLNPQRQRLFRFINSVVKFMCRLADKVAIVTGASKGIGRGVAMALAAAGARVAVNYSTDRGGAERVAQAIMDSGGKAVAIGADVSKAADVARLFKEVDAAFGRLDVLVNNAGIFRFAAFCGYQRGELSYSLQHQRARVDPDGQEAIKRFGSDGGSVINFSSIVGIRYREPSFTPPRRERSRR
jgi:3-oxoacyl-[acyl-carrier protein] reductase